MVRCCKGRTGRASPRGQQPRVERGLHVGAPVLHADLLVDPVAVGVHRLGGDPQLRGDLRATVAPGDEGEHRLLAPAQAVQQLPRAVGMPGGMAVGVPVGVAGGVPVARGSRCAEAAAPAEAPAADVAVVEETPAAEVAAEAPVAQ